MAAILNLDVLNLYGRTRDFSALGLEQSSLGEPIGQAAAAEGLRVTANEEALIRGSYFRSDHFSLAAGRSLARVGVPGTSHESGSDFVGHPAGWGKEQKDLYVAKRYHQPSDELLPWFTYDGAIQQLRVTVRTAVLSATLPAATGAPTPSSVRPARHGAKPSSLPPRARGPAYLPGRLRPAPLPQERFWNCPSSTGFRSPGCSRTPGRRSGTAP